MTDRERLMKAAATLLLAGLRGPDTDVKRGLSAVTPLLDDETFSGGYDRASEALVKLVREICP